MAKLYFNYGAMGSSKSLRLLALAHNLEEKNIPTIIIKPNIDTRDGDNKIVSRAGLSKYCISVGVNVNLYEKVKEINNVMKTHFSELSWVLVDEAQFLTEKQINQLSDIVDFLNINVYCYGLRTDFESRTFDGSRRLFELADEIEEVKSYCECGGKASINARFDENGKIITEGNQILVGGNDIYKPLCRKCWKKEIRKKNLENETSY